MPQFSVIIPVHNRADLIGGTIESVLKQAGEIEIIVVDDGSTEQTVAVVESFGPKVQLLRQENKGPGAARNLGLRAATGQYAAFLDSDDLWLSWTAQIYAQAIQRHDQPAFIAGKPFIFQAESEIGAVQNRELSTLEFTDYLASGDQWRWYSASSFVMRRDALLAAGGFTDEWVNAEDAEAALRMGVAGKFVQILSPATFAYRKHAGSAMANFDRSFAGIQRMIRQEKSNQFPGGAARARERARIIAAHTRPMALELLHSNRPAAWELYRQTFGWHLSMGRWRFLLGFPLRAVRAGRK